MMQTLLLQFIQTLDRTMKGSPGRPGVDTGLMNLTLSQVQYLEAIAGQDQATITGISESLKVTKPSATTAVQKLIQQGYISKIQSDDDRRVFILQLTESGRRLAQAKKQALLNYEIFIRAALSPTELAEFETTLQKLVAFFEHHHSQEHTP
jgi:DNA-binding MarR family transcriptional regulator